MKLIFLLMPESENLNQTDRLQRTQKRKRTASSYQTSNTLHDKDRDTSTPKALGVDSK